ncbi:MAG: DMT family transporter [Candidatus Electryoneaceae bacterium]|nr:DMT family transporter [Candidatus Electryoneaceae bacterium]
MTEYRRRFIIATLVLVLLTIIWGLTFSATKSALSVTDPMHFLSLRFLVAVGLSTPFVIMRRKRVTLIDDELKNCTARTVWLAGFGVGLLLLMGFTLQTIGMSYTTASRSGFFTGLLVVLTPPLALLFKTSRASKSTWIALPIAVAGIYLLSDPKIHGLNFGDWLTIGCALSFALQMILLEVVARKIRDKWMLTYVQMLTLFVGATLWSIFQGVEFQMTTMGWLMVLYNGIFGGIIAVWLQTSYQPDVPAGHAALIFILEPVFAGLFAFLLLGEQWTSQALVGAGLIVIAMFASSIVWKTPQKG